MKQQKLMISELQFNQKSKKIRFRSKINKNKSR